MVEVLSSFDSGFPSGLAGVAGTIPISDKKSRTRQSEFFCQVNLSILVTLGFSEVITAPFTQHPLRSTHFISILANHGGRALLRQGGVIAYRTGWGMLELHDMAGHLIRRLHQISASVFAERMKAAGIDLTPVQFAALEALRTQPDVDQATLAGMIAYDRVTLGGVIDRLEAKGLVSRIVSPQDRRARLVRLTETGERLLQDAGPIVRGFQDTILTGLDAAERQQLIALMRKTTAAGNDQSRAPLLPPKTG
jgi:DNA-binding MarR family transcriptional regulator